MHLVPNEDLLHPDGTTITYYETDPLTGESIQKKDVIHQGDVRAYHGVVVHPEYSRDRLEEDKVGVRRDIYGPFEDGVVGRAAM